jgi:hypothetical protein
MKNKISDLRNHLFVVLEELSDPDSKYDLEKAKVIANVAQTIINSASVENQYLKKIDLLEVARAVDSLRRERWKILKVLAKRIKNSTKIKFIFVLSFRWCASRLKEYGTMYFVSPAQ